MLALLYILTLYVTAREVYAFSPEEFRRFYATSTEKIEAPPHTRTHHHKGDENRIYGYIAPTDRPTYAIPAPQRPWRHPPPHPYHQPESKTHPSSYQQTTKTPQRYYSMNRYESQRVTPSYHAQGIEVGPGRLEHVQNLVHLRNIHSLEQLTNVKRRIPYGIIRSDRDYWEDYEVDDRNNNSTRHSWTANAIIADQEGQESVVIERGVRYKSPHSPKNLEAKSRYDTVEIETVPQQGSFRGRRGFKWDESTENSIDKKRPTTTLLKRNKNKSIEIEIEDIENQLHVPETRSVLRRQPVTFRTKVSTSIGVEEGPNFQVLSLPNVQSFDPQSTPSQIIIPLVPPPSSNSIADNIASIISTTSQNDNRAVLPTPQDILSQMLLGTTQSNFGTNIVSSSYSTTPTSYGSGSSYGYGSTGSQYGPNSSGFIPSPGPGPSSPSGGSQGTATVPSQTYGSGSGTGSTYNPGVSYGTVTDHGNSAPGSSSPSYGSGGPSYGSGGPSYGSGEPLHGSGGPSHGSGGPSYGSGGPSHGSGGPSYGSGGTTHGSGGTTHGSGEPSYGSGGPSHGSGGPSYGSDKITMKIRELLKALMTDMSGWTVMTLEKLFHLLRDPSDLIDTCEDSRGVAGTCISETQCTARGGDGAGQSSCSSTASVCCIITKEGCGITTSENNTIWKNGDIDAVPLECNIRVNKLSDKICQIRLDFLKHELASPENGACILDKLVVYGQNINSGIPHLCGQNTGQHIYIDVSTVPGPIDLSMKIGDGNEDRQWDIQISQIACDSLYRPPANCLQYFTGSRNTFTTFNFRIDQNTSYTNFLNYAICIRKERGYCSIEYRNNVIPGTVTFDIVNTARIPGSTAPAVNTIPDGEAGVGVQQCPDDYIILGGVRVCGSVLNDGAVNPKFTENAPVRDRTNGPFIAQFISNGENVGRGFSLDYQQTLC